MQRDGQHYLCHTFLLSWLSTIAVVKPGSPQWSNATIPPGHPRRSGTSGRGSSDTGTSRRNSEPQSRGQQRADLGVSAVQSGPATEEDQATASNPPKTPPAEFLNSSVGPPPTGGRIEKPLHDANTHPSSFGTDAALPEAAGRHPAGITVPA